ncbi:MAG: rod shape-determining protein MreC [Gammaproteobacteria bacterium]|nr:rod shape-determining protein MreC [Gammaproteobacteria bacterium]
MNTSLSDSTSNSLFLRGPALGVKLTLLVSLSILLMMGENRGNPQLQTARQWLSWALTPITWAAASPAEVVGGVDHLRSRESLLNDNRELRERLLKQDARLLRLESLEAENIRIRELLASSSSLEDRVLIAEILATSQDPYRHQIVLNKGGRDGVYRGQALVDADGIMGQIVQVNPGSSVALLITDPDHGIPVEINRTGLQTIALGRGDGHGLSLPYLPGNADVKVGDLLVTSGLGGRFPAGYPVGTVHELKHAGGESFMEAIAYPKAKLSQGRQALLVWSERALPSSGTDDEPIAVPIDLPVKPESRSPATPAAAPAQVPAAASNPTSAPAATTTTTPSVPPSAAATPPAAPPAGKTTAPPALAPKPGTP